MRLEPVVERPYGVEKFWLPLPEQPWPAFIKLSGTTPDGEVALVVYQLCTHGADVDEPLSSSQLIQRFPGALPGGLAVVEGKIEIYPSCCCGLEAWPEWKTMVDTGEPPWLGHDPWPWVEIDTASLTIWADGGLGNFDRERVPSILTTMGTVNDRLKDVESALRAFAERVKSVLRQAGVREAHEIAASFIGNFVPGA